MSSPPSSTEERLITGEELARMGDIGRCELIDGRIIRMGPRAIATAMSKHGSRR